MAENLMKKPQFAAKVQPTLRAMEVGDAVYFPIERLKVVCATAYDLGTMLGRTYKTQRYKQLGYMQVIRLH